MFTDLEDDPFFSDPFHAHQQHLRQMMTTAPGDLEHDVMLNLTNGRTCNQGCPRQRATKEAVNANNGASSSMDPFSKMSSMMEQMRKGMFEVQTNHASPPSDSISHSLNTTSVMSYAKVGNEPPKVFQASSHIHNVPGGLKEIKRAVKDSESGLEKMSIGHHIKDRAHVIQKSRNQKTGDEEIDQEFINLNEADAPLFDEEWQEKVSKFMSPGTHPYGIQDIKLAMEGKRTKCNKRSTAPFPAPTSSTCGCPGTSSAATGMKHGRR
uniref:myeloid leukemia factor 1 isoform X2 n=1 Tax=Pristiophorus japonicus TaxID=55135 RepID=UPI00398EBA33